jgi:hypothetical protein
MDIEILGRFFFWCMLINFGVYVVTALAVLVLRDFVCRINMKMFGLDEQTVLASIQSYLATYKLLITAFNFAPWLAILVIK